MASHSDLVFQAISWWSGDLEDDEDNPCDDGSSDEEKPPANNEAYFIKIFGVTSEGQSVALTVRNFKPCFYVKLSSAWSLVEVNELVAYLQKQKYVERVDRVTKVDFVGFTNNRKDPFLRISFSTHKGMKFLDARLANTGRSASASFSSNFQMPRVIKKNGGHLRDRIYESNILPMLRFCHARDLQPCGWMRVPAGAIRKGPGCQQLAAVTKIDAHCDWTAVSPVDRSEIAPLTVASFDIECNSANGDFPLAKGEYKYAKLAKNLVQAFQAASPDGEYNAVGLLEAMICRSFGLKMGADRERLLPAIFVPMVEGALQADHDVSTVRAMAEDMWRLCMLPKNMSDEDRANKAIGMLRQCRALPKLGGDEIIQIGTCCQRYGAEAKDNIIVTLGTCDPIAGVEVQPCETEREMLLRWAELVRARDPDIMMGYNIFGFDMAYIKDRAEELDCWWDISIRLGKFARIENPYKEVNLSSSALGDNVLKLIDMQGRVLIDLMKVVQRDHRLDTYKLDAVASHFMGMNKKDVSPKDVFRLQRGSSADRAVIADYCVQDCVLCNQLATKLDTVSNNVGMANVCSVPLSFIFMRGQGVKIHSLVAKQCQQDGYVIPVIKAAENRAAAEDDTYEGAIVLDPQEGLYVDDPISVLDYASLYPSSMISENLSHDTLVLDPAYSQIEGVEYVDVRLDERRTCRFAQQPEGVLPRILKSLLKQRKETRKRIELKRAFDSDGKVLAEGYASKDGGSLLLSDGSGGSFELPKDGSVVVEDAYNEFQQAVLDGLQLAYKVTANSLYGQMGASTSPLCLKDIAASTTATGRNMILMARDFIEQNYDATIVYGDTDSIFVKFRNVERDAEGRVVRSLVGKEAILASIRTAVDASKAFKKLIKPPHDLEYEKTFWPFILFSKKRYVGNLYEFDDVKYKQKSMGIVLKRRDNAPIVKKIFGGSLDIILNKRDVEGSVAFVQRALDDLVKGVCEVEDLVITKSLKAHYKDPDRIAHHVLAQRMAQRDPGNKPQVNDRIPYMYVDSWVCEAPNKKVLQGDRIEHPAYAREKGLKPDYKFYITNQIMKPVQQLYAIVLERLAGYDPARLAEFRRALPEGLADDKVKDKVQAFRESEVKRLLFDPVLEKLEKQLQREGVLAKQQGMRAITAYFTPAASKK